MSDDRLCGYYLLDRQLSWCVCGVLTVCLCFILGIMWNVVKQRDPLHPYAFALLLPSLGSR